MTRRSLKSRLVIFFSCVLFLTYTLPPCNCSAEELPTLKQKNSSHSCCDEANSNQDASNDECDNCLSCTISESCSLESALSSKAEAESLNQIYFIDFSWISNSRFQYASIKSFPKVTGPPGFQLSNYSNISIFLQRFLI